MNTDGLSHGFGSLHLVKQGRAWAVYREARIRHGEFLGYFRTKREALASVGDR